MLTVAQKLPSCQKISLEDRQKRDLTLPLVPVHGDPLLSDCDCFFDPTLIPITLFAYDLSLVPVNEMVIVHNMVRYRRFMDHRLRRFTSGSCFYARGKFFLP